jgi:hypothetical protein
MPEKRSLTGEALVIEFRIHLANAESFRMSL